MDGAQPVAQLPVHALTEAPTYRLKGRKPDPRRGVSPDKVRPTPQTPGEALLCLLGSPNIASKRAVYQQYDYQVQTNTVVGPGADAAVLRIKGTQKAIALCTDGNGRYCHLDPYRGGAIAVAEACRNISCVGARPLAITNCLNFGNPERPEVYYQLERCIRGMARACRVLGVPVVSGNVSLYNETQGQAIYPTPIVGALGLLEDAQRHTTSAFQGEGEVVALLGADAVVARPQDLAGSEYQEAVLGQVRGRPVINLALEHRVQQACRTAVSEGLLRSAHDCSDGGLAVTLAESCIPGGIGFTGAFQVEGLWAGCLFGEAQSRIVVSLRPADLSRLQEVAAAEGVPVALLGTTGGDRFTIGGLVDLSVSQMDDAWNHGLERALARPLDG